MRSFFSHLVLEPVSGSSPRQVSFFRSEGIYAEELNALFTREALSLRIGKFDPVFGMAADMSPGLFGGDLAHGYDLLGALGIATTITLSSSEIEADGDEADYTV